MSGDNFLISASNVRVPLPIYGTAWKKEKTAGLVERAIDLGFRGIDTACQPQHYNEAGVGEGVAVALRSGLRREHLYIQSKFSPLNCQESSNVPYDPSASLTDQVAQSFLRSLDNLRTTYLDALLLHSPLSEPTDTMQIWRVMEDIFDRDGCKQLGVCNFYNLKQLEHLYHTARVKPVILQNRFYAQTQYDKTIRKFCQQHRIIYQSFWTLSANPDVLAHPVLLALAKKYQRTAAQIFFRFLCGCNIIPLTGTTSDEHMKQALAIVEFELHSSEIQMIESLL
ncbi:aldo/keto reductase [Duganella sp. FT135W]|uniref:Aldo/keto reductase n=1 Tax=Duganella flavida TaxID=2692175 RepID=A0A6L8K5G6_9BURK|nr:aldo/keto reductase [Duganella flavida]MYM22185.1 aldo/keto reductase [Duganella flavida]